MRYILNKILYIFLIYSPWVHSSTHGGFHLFLKDFFCSSSLFPRDVYVYLPSTYQENKQVKYPVLIMHDGQNLFDPSRAYLGQTWKAEATLNKLIAGNRITPLIVIAIDNTKDRIAEYTFDQDPTVDIIAGRAQEYLSCITNDILPLMHKYLSVSDKREDIAILGSSLGGLVSLYAAHQHPELFGKIGALSPSLWWNNRSIGQIVMNSTFLPKKVYIDSGDVGGEKADDVIWLHDLYLSRGLSRDKQLKMLIQHGANHSEQYWAQRFPIAVEFLFPKTKKAE